MFHDNDYTLRIGDISINPPIIQGGMGIRVSCANLAAAVANAGCVGVIAATGIGAFEDQSGIDFRKFNSDAMRDEIRKCRKMTDGLLGVNAMVALSDFDTLVQTAAEEKVDMIISGAGLPVDLPKYVGNSDTKLIPIVSSVRALEIVRKRWHSRYSRNIDAVIVEGVMAGGHLGYSYDEVAGDSIKTLEQTVKEVVNYSQQLDKPFPVIAAGGIFDGEDIARYLRLGAAGVQMGTRFVCTDECDVDIAFKQAYLDCGPEDLTIIKSPVGLPGRVINSNFVERIKQGQTIPFECRYKCLRSCKPNKAPYCIAKVLANAAKGKLDEAFVFAGSNAYKCNEILPVKILVEKLKAELSQALAVEVGTK